MEIEAYTAPDPVGPPHVPVESVTSALIDAAALRPVLVHPSVALGIARGSEKTRRLRLERLARVVMTTDPRFTPEMVWSADWTALDPAALLLLDNAIKRTWSSAATRNAMRDSVRSLIREMCNAGLITTEQERHRLNSLRPERPTRDPEKQARGHLEASAVEAAFHQLALDPSIKARRDAALIAVMVGGGLRRAEPLPLALHDLDLGHDSLVVHGKGDVVRTVPLAAGVRRALRDWLHHRGDEPGPLFTRVAPARNPVRAQLTRISANTVALVVAQRFGPSVAPHDLRRTFIGNLLDSGADLSTVSKIVGHQNPATTAGYDRRGHAARQRAVDKLDVPFESAGSH